MLLRSLWVQVAAKLTQDILAAATEEDGQGGGIKIQSYHRAKLQRLQQHRREALMEKLQRDENLIRDALAVLRCPVGIPVHSRWPWTGLVPVLVIDSCICALCLTGHQGGDSQRWSWWWCWRGGCG